MPVQTEFSPVLLQPSLLQTVLGIAEDVLGSFATEDIVSIDPIPKVEHTSFLS
jgi:hypothetical protein